MTEGVMNWHWLRLLSVGMLFNMKSSMIFCLILLSSILCSLLSVLDSCDTESSTEKIEYDGDWANELHSFVFNRDVSIGVPYSELLESWCSSASLAGVP